MKQIKILRMLGIVLILSLLMIAIPALPVQATNDLYLSVSSGKIGDSVTITGTNFTPTTAESEKWVRIIFAEDDTTIGFTYIDNNVNTYKVVANAFVGEEYTEEEGSFSTTFTVPSSLTDGSIDQDVTSGTYYIYITFLGQTIIKSKASFTVTGGDVEIYPDEGPVETLVEIIGEDFPADEDIEIEYDGDEIDIEDGDDETDSHGDFESFIIIPESKAGDHDITVIIGSTEVEVEFIVEPEIIISPQSGEAGTEVTVSGTGFARRPKEVIIYFNNQSVGIETMDTRGSFTITFFVSEGLTAGVYDIEAEDDDRNLATAKFTLNVPPPPEPTPEPETEPETEPTPSPTGIDINYSGDTIGSLIGVGGAGFLPNAPVTLKYDDMDVATVTTDANGIFMVTFQAPPSKHGEHIITASDGTNTNQVTFTVEAIAPATPPPLLPETGVKVKSPITFDWEDVIDESLPVTYDLQIASDDDFPADSIVMEKTALEESSYTFTEKEELELASQEAPYYWRIRAVDAALNESEWTGAREFYVSAGLGFPNWALYTLLGIGAVLIFGIGYWLGRRTAFYY